MAFGHSDDQSRQRTNDSTLPSSTVSPTGSIHAGTYEVVLEPEDDPQQLPLMRRWVSVVFLSTAAICITGVSSMVRLDYTPEQGIVLTWGLTS